MAHRLQTHEGMIQAYMNIFNIGREEAISRLESQGLIPMFDGVMFDIDDWSYALVEAEFDIMAEDDESFKDAKLSTKKRKKLKGSTFCGPDRSFPVPDCAHVTAARRLIGRAKGLSASQKARILACVSRKAKSLGCKSAKKKEKK